MVFRDVATGGCIASHMSRRFSSCPSRANAIAALSLHPAVNQSREVNPRNGTAICTGKSVANDPPAGQNVVLATKRTCGLAFFLRSQPPVAMQSGAIHENANSPRRAIHWPPMGRPVTTTPPFPTMRRFNSRRRVMTILAARATRDASRWLDLQHRFALQILDPLKPF